MILPEKYTKINPKRIFVPNHLFLQARKYHYNEDFKSSIKIINNVLNMDLNHIPESQFSLLDLYALYGWNLVLLRDFEGLEDWSNSIISQFVLNDTPPEFEIIDLWRFMMTGRHDLALERSYRYLEEYSDIIDANTPSFLFVRGYAKHFMGEHNEVIEDCETAYAIYRYFRMANEGARIANFIGTVQLDDSDYNEALKWYRRSLEYYSQTKLLRKQSMVFLNVGVTLYKVGDYSAAFDSLEKSLQLGLDGKWIHRQCFANIAIGNVYRLTRDFEQARKHIHTAYNQAQELGFRREEALSLEFLGDVYRDEGRPVEARRFYKRALAIALDISSEGDIVMEIQRRIGECLTMESNPAAASDHLAQALKMARRLGDRFEEGVTLRVMAETTVALGDTLFAIKTIRDSVDLLGEIGAKHELAISLLRCGEYRLLQLDATSGVEGIPSRTIELNEIWEDTTRSLDLLLSVDVPYWTEKARNLAERVSRHKTNLEKERQASQFAAADGSGRYRTPDLIIHTSGVMRDLIQICDMFASSDDPVLISGETGTGKELIARRVHNQSSRKSKPLVTVNVAAIAPTMFEREFFGHTKGSFSGADRDGEGFAASAHGGTLFLDEIGELPPSMQPKLLRLIQEGTYQAIGDPKVRHTDIRLVAATNANLSDMVERGKFRSDLYFRLKVLELNLPPVRERQEDILPLLRYFLGQAVGRPVDLAEFFNYSSLGRLVEFDWPGNVREIAMVARRAVMEMKVKGKVQTGFCSDTLGSSAVRPLKVERARIMLALEECSGNRLEAARKLNMGRSTLYRRMEKLGIPTRKK